MSKDTSIQWCDSSLNLQAGCDGCELWNGKVRICYAGKQTEKRAGFKGWPKKFEEPVLFLDRLAPALKWRDLTGTDREDKPWLNKLPRIIFLNDMGDTFSAKLPQFWLAPLLPLLASSPHQFLLLTKRPSKLLEFAQKHPLPPNVWPGTTVTSAKTIGRVEHLRKIETGGPKFISAEPLWSYLPEETFAGMQWVIFGGESGDRDDAGETDATPTNIDWIERGVMHARRAGARVFVKQLGTAPFWEMPTEATVEKPRREFVRLADRHGGEWNQWPMRLRLREMPAMSHQPTLLL